MMHTQAMPWVTNLNTPVVEANHNLQGAYWVSLRNHERQNTGIYFGV